MCVHCRKFGKYGSLKYGITYILAAQRPPKDKQLCFFFFVSVYGDKISPPSLSSSKFGSDFLGSFVSYFFHLKFYHENCLEFLGYLFNSYLSSAYDVSCIFPGNGDIVKKKINMASSSWTL